MFDRIAAGGMASVHIGRLIGQIGFSRTVAIKRLHPHFAEDPEFVSMFLDEGRLAARVRHPNVVQTLDVVTANGELFLVMDYVQGEALSKLVRRMREKNERIAPEMVASIMVGVLHGLHAAHEATDDDGKPLGIVHRDVSPHNILVGTDGIARVLDFGVAKAVGRLQTTREGQIKGKLSYMSPEQIRALPVDRRTDVYAASAVLWEALTGRRLFEGDDDGSVTHRVLEGRVTAPSAHAPGLPPALDALTLRGLSLRPEDRYQTAREMARALEEAVPLAVASRVGEWVEKTASDVLSQRATLLDEIEIASARSDAEPAPPPREPAHSETDLLTQLSAASPSTSRSEPSPHNRLTRSIALLAIGAAASGMFVFGVTRGRASSLPAPAPVSSPSETATPVPHDVTAASTSAGTTPTAPSAAVHGTHRRWTAPRPAKSADPYDHM